MRLLVIALSAFFGSCGAQPPAQETTQHSAIVAETSPNQVVLLTPDDRARLAPLAENGDFAAAESLALDAFWGDEETPATTLKWMRLWARGEDDALPLLTWLLSRSCDQEERMEAARLWRRYMTTHTDPTPRPGATQSYDDRLREMEWLAGEPQRPDCLNLE